MVYFIQDSVQKFIKIGQTQRKSLVHRLMGLQTANPNPLVCLATIETENDDRKYHRIFQKAHHSREWFRPEPELLEFIASLPTTEWVGYILPAVRKMDSESIPSQWPKVGNRYRYSGIKRAGGMRYGCWVEIGRPNT